MNWIGWLLAIASSALAMTAAGAETRWPEIHVEERIEYYDVVAKDRPTLWNALRVPGLALDREASGQTNAAFVIDWRFTQTPQRCVINALSIRLELRIILPRWAPDAELPDGLESDWISIRDRIAAHENKHRQNALDAAFAMRDGFTTAMQRQDCIGVERAFNRVRVIALNNQQVRDRLVDQQPVLRQ